jgi:hypothetical protein
VGQGNKTTSLLHPTVDQDLAHKSMEIHKKKLNTSSKSFAQSALGQIQANTNSSNKIMPIEQLEEYKKSPGIDKANFKRDSRLQNLYNAHKNQIN